MNAYLLSRYLHVVGALGLFVALGLDWAGLAQLRRARTAEQVREWARVLGWLRWLDPFSLVAAVHTRGRGPRSALPRLGGFRMDHRHRAGCRRRSHHAPVDRSSGIAGLKPSP